MEAWGCFNIVNEARCVHPASDIEGRSEKEPARIASLCFAIRKVYALRVLDRIRGETSGFALREFPSRVRVPSLLP